MMENGRYTEAIQTWETVLRRKPNDPEALAGLQESRRGWLGQSLIEVRKARTSGNPAAATDLLLDINAKEKSWNVRPSGPAVFTQQEETQAASRYAIEALTNSLSAAKPLRTASLARKFDPLFEKGGAGTVAQFRTLKAKAREQGKADCRSWEKLNFQGKPDLAEFKARICSFWGVSPKFPGYDPDERKQSLFREVRVASNQVKGLSPVELAELTRQLQASFEKTPWYAVDGKNLVDLTLAGEWNLSEQRYPIQLEHQYYEEEKYIAHEQVKKVRQIAYTAQETVVNPQTGQAQINNVTKYRNEEYFETEPREKTRQVPKSFPFGAWKIDQRLNLAMTGEASLLDRKLQFVLQRQLQKEDTAHEVSRPSIGLNPKKANLADPAQWLRSQYPQAAAELQSQLLSQWKERYCSVEGNNDPLLIAQRYRQCLRLPAAAAETPAAAQEWHLQTYGLGVAEIEALLQNR